MAPLRVGSWCQHMTVIPGSGVPALPDCWPQSLERSTPSGLRVDTSKRSELLFPSSDKMQGGQGRYQSSRWWGTVIIDGLIGVSWII